MQSEVIPANRPSEPAVTASAEMEPLVAAGAEIVEMELPEEMVPPEEPQREEGESETTESEAAPVPTNQDGIETVVPVESESAVVPTDTAASKPIAELPAAPQPAAAAIEASSANAKFEAEPFLAPRPRPRRIALAEGVAAAAVVIATFLVFALDSRRAADMTAGAAVPGTSLPRATTPGSGITDVEMIETRGTAPGASPAGAVASTSKPSADVQATAQIVRRSNAYDDYIAPPYSSMPMQPSVAPRSVAAPSGQVAVSLESNPGSGMNSVRPEHSASPSLSAAVAGPVMAKTVAISRAYRDPDAMLVGDAPNGSLSPAVVSNRPIHPNVSAGVMAGYLVSAPKPDYPLMAKIAHIDGPVVLRVEITRDGEVAETHVVSGHHMLRHAAEEAVRHWRYRPYEVDGRPVGVSTTIAVRFRSGR
jgi:TonB family protein